MWYFDIHSEMITMVKQINIPIFSPSYLFSFLFFWWEYLKPTLRKLLVFITVLTIVMLYVNFKIAVDLHSPILHEKKNVWQENAKCPSITFYIDYIEIIFLYAGFSDIFYSYSLFSLLNVALRKILNLISLGQCWYRTTFLKSAWELRNFPTQHINTPTHRRKKGSCLTEKE
jgi:hypothetical protein